MKLFAMQIENPLNPTGPRLFAQIAPKRFDLLTKLNETLGAACSCGKCAGTAADVLLGHRVHMPNTLGLANIAPPRAEIYRWEKQ